MDAQDNSEPVTPSLPEAASRSGMKRVLLVVGVSGLAILGAAAARYWQPIEVVPGAVAHKVFAVGGLDRGASEPWQKIEAVREIQGRSSSAQAMLKLLARGA